MPKILLVEDSAVQRQLLRRRLAGCDYQVETASNGYQAIGLAQREQPDIILMDIDMPGLDGLDACRALRRNVLTCHIPVVILSACEQDACRLRALMRGAVSYLTKPVDAAELCATLSAIKSGE